MAVNLPQPLYVPQARQDQRSIAEQALLTFLGQAPGIGMDIYQAYQQNQAKKTQEDAAIQALFLEAQAGNPDALRAFATESLGVSPMENPVDPTQTLPGVAPTLAALDRLTPEARKTLGAIVPMLPQMQAMRMSRAGEKRDERREVRDIETHEKEMELRAGQILGQGYRNRIDAVLSSPEYLANTQRLQELDVAEKEFRLERLLPAQMAAEEAQRQLAKANLTALGHREAMNYWAQMTGDVQDLIRTYAVNIEDPVKQNEKILQITNGLLQDRTPEDFGKLFSEYYHKAASGTLTAEDRVNLYQNLAGDTFQTMATRYGLNPEEAERFRTELDAAGGSMPQIYGARIRQIQGAKELALLQIPKEEHPQVEQEYAAKEAEYRLLFNLYRKLHDMKPVNLTPATVREDSEALMTVFELFTGSQPGQSTPGFTLNPAQLGANVGTALGSGNMQLPPAEKIFGTWEPRTFTGQKRNR